MTTTVEKITYVRISEREIPAGVKWHTPRRYQGQAVVVQYGHFGSDEAVPGDPFKRRITENGKITYYFAGPMNSRKG